MYQEFKATVMVSIRNAPIQVKPQDIEKIMTQTNRVEGAVLHFLCVEAKEVCPHCADTGRVTTSTAKGDEFVKRYCCEAGKK